MREAGAIGSLNVAAMTASRATSTDSDAGSTATTAGVATLGAVAVVLLIALLILVGLSVLLMFIVWLTGRLMFSKTPIPVELLEYAGRGDHAEGFERDMEEPGLEELEEFRIRAVFRVGETQRAAPAAAQRVPGPVIPPEEPGGTCLKVRQS